MAKSLTDPIRVTVVYAQPQRQWLQPVEMPSGATVQLAIERSGLLQAIPELRLEAIEVGIFHRRCGLDAPLRDGDRVEIYRPLRLDPKEARRLRAARNKA
ncbi:MAG TPA: RnfH family protein [Burkholderiaceae bacterium]|nr:RnfH family protein [Burkholderiaceae bacterium]